MQNWEPRVTPNTLLQKIWLDGPGYSRQHVCSRNHNRNPNWKGPSRSQFHAGSDKLECQPETMFPDRTANTMFFFFPRLSASSFALPSSVFAPRFQLPLLAFSLFRVFHWFSAPPVLSLSAFSILSQRFAFPRLWAPLSLFRLCSRALRVSQQRFRFQEIPVAFSLHVLKWNHYSVLACSKKTLAFLVQ